MKGILSEHILVPICPLCQKEYKRNVPLCATNSSGVYWCNNCARLIPVNDVSKSAHITYGIGTNTDWSHIDSFQKTRFVWDSVYVSQED